MNKSGQRPRCILISIVAICTLGISACSPKSPDTSTSDAQFSEPQQQTETMSNPVFHFEIPVSDLDRAVAFYEATFGYKLEREVVDSYQMAFFPRDPDSPGASGALAKGDVYIPAKTGPIIYFDVDDIDAVVARATARGAKVLFEKKNIGEGGYVAEIEDSEGNRIALNQVPVD